MKNIILIGNPNTGKTTLFNSLTKASEHTGNWHGVTVDSKTKTYMFEKENYEVVDLPGIYSLSPLSFEEEVSVNYLYEHVQDLVVSILDINNIKRNLFLTLELIEAGFKVLVVVNQTTKANSLVNTVDVNLLEKNLQTSVIKIDAKNLNQVKFLKKHIQNYFKNNKTKNDKKNTNKLKNNNLFDLNNNFKNILNYSDINFLIKKNNTDLNNNFIVSKCLENDYLILKKLDLSSQDQQKLIVLQNKINIENIISEKFKLIEKLTQNCVFRKKEKVYGKSKLDKFVLNKYLCLPIFLLVLCVVFYLTFFSVGKFLSTNLAYFVQEVIGKNLVSFIKSLTSSKILIDFFETALIGGVGAVFSFLPQVVILFLCLSVLEDSGYLSRVAFCLDDIFKRVGLSGKSVYTLLMGFGCSTSACLTAKTMEDKNSKIKTAMLTPYVSCSAKLPIYSVVGGAFFGASNVFVILALYLLGVVVAMLLSVFYEKTFLKSKEQSFILEFPPYKNVSIKRLFEVSLQNIKQYMIRIGSVLISVNVIVWVLSSFSLTFGFCMQTGQKSILQSLGHFLAPIFKPLGFGSWGATSALISGLIAKEVIVSTLAMINGVNGANVSSSLTNTASAVYFTPASAISFMVFCLLYSPCLATFSVLKKEIGKKWTYISLIVQFFIAYVLSMVLYLAVSVILQKGIVLFLIFITFALLVASALKFLLKKWKF